MENNFVYVGETVQVGGIWLATIRTQHGVLVCFQRDLDKHGAITGVVEKMRRNGMNQQTVCFTEIAIEE